MKILEPSARLLVKLGSLIVHYQEIRSDPHEFDVAAIATLESDPDVVEWIAQMTKEGFLPVKRK